MIEELFPRLYRIEIPLPDSPLGSVNSYLVKGSDEYLLIDTGMNREECWQEMTKALSALNVELAKMNFLITHFHVDHIGLLGRLASDMSRVYLSKVESQLADYGSGRGQQRRQQFGRMFLANGFPHHELKQAMGTNLVQKYGLKKKVRFTVVQEDNSLPIGDYAFTCVLTPGHSPGHMCLYEAERKVLISGDHLLFDITPNILPWPDKKDSLGMYLDSLDKVDDLDVELVLPGHRNVGRNHRARIAQLKSHHKARLNEVLFFLSDGEKTAYEIAPLLTWESEDKPWATLPAIQKWFAVGEALAHLRYLEERGKAQKRLKAATAYYGLPTG